MLPCPSRMVLASPSSTTTSIVVSRFSYCSTLSLNNSTAIFPKTSSRVGELRSDMVWLLEKFKIGKARKFERLGLRNKISQSVPFIGGLP